MPERDCCPACRSVRVYHKRRKFGTAARTDAAEYYCQDCGEHFDEPETKQVTQRGPTVDSMARQLARLGEQGGDPLAHVGGGD